MSISKLLSGLVLVWGVLLACMAIPREFAPLAAIRFLLGAAESLISPGFVLLNARFYTVGPASIPTYFLLPGRDF